MDDLHIGRACFIAHLRNDREYASNQCIKDPLWRQMIDAIMANVSNGKLITSMIIPWTDEYNEFLEFIDGNGLSYKRPKGYLRASVDGSISQKVFIRYELVTEE